MFKKKIWKRGDKLNAKELNRIEDSIFSIISVDEDVSKMDTDGPIFNNWSITVDDFKNICKNKQKVCLKITIKEIPESIPECIIWFYPSQITEGTNPKYDFFGFAPNMGYLSATLYIDNGEFRIPFKVLVPDT